MIGRQQQQQLHPLLHTFPMGGILDQRQVGKNTMDNAFVSTDALQTVYLDCKRPADMAMLADFELFLARHAHDLRLGSLAREGCHCDGSLKIRMTPLDQRPPKDFGVRHTAQTLWALSCR